MKNKTVLTKMDARHLCYECLKHIVVPEGIESFYGLGLYRENRAS